MELERPLRWPVGWPRTEAGMRKIAPFSHFGERVPFDVAHYGLGYELDLLGATHAVLSADRQFRSKVNDPGVAVYFLIRGRGVCLACDKWDRQPDNIRAITKHIEAMRGMQRWGVGTTDQAFAGYEALPQPKTWRDVLGHPETLADAEKAYRRLAMSAHPDAGGSTSAMMALNAAIESARNELAVFNAHEE